MDSVCCQCAIAAAAPCRRCRSRRAASLQRRLCRRQRGRRHRRDCCDRAGPAGEYTETSGRAVATVAAPAPCADGHLMTPHPCPSCSCALQANPICLWSEYTLKTTGAGLPPGPGEAQACSRLCRLAAAPGAPAATPARSGVLPPRRVSHPPGSLAPQVARWAPPRACPTWSSWALWAGRWPPRWAGPGSRELGSAGAGELGPAGASWLSWQAGSRACAPAMSGPACSQAWPGHKSEELLCSFA